MVIFDRTMLTGAGNQFINPEYLRPLSPLPSELDAKSSPLALLAKTCSQIGAEPATLPNGKATSSGKSTSGHAHSGKRHESANKDGKSVSPYNGFRTESRSGTGSERFESRSRSGSVEIKVTDSTSAPTSQSRDELLKGRASLSSNVSSLSTSIVAAEDDANNDDDDDTVVVERKRRRSESPVRRSPSLTPASSSSSSAKSDTKTSKPVTSTSMSDPSPIIRSGLEVLSGSGPNSGRELLFPGLRAPQIPPSLTYPGFASGSTFPSQLANPFWSSFMTSSNVCRDPLCADPFCPTSFRNQQLFAAATGRLPASSPSLSSYSSLFSAAAAVQQREAALMAAQRAAAMAQAAVAASNPSGSTGGQKPYVCNWVAGSDYCGRRFSSSEELLMHLKTHTNLSAAASLSSPLTSSLASSLTSSLTSPLTSTTSTASLAAASRFHPYARPVPPSLASALNPALGMPPGYPNPYASLYPALFPRPPLL